MFQFNCDKYAAASLGIRDFRPFENLLPIACQLLNADSVTFTVQSDGQQHILASVNTPTGKIPAANSICTEVSDSGLPTSISDTRTHPNRSCSFAEIGGGVYRSYCGVPVSARNGKLSGVLSCYATDANAFADGSSSLLLKCARLIEDFIRLNESVVFDELTGVFNRQFFTQLLNREWRRSMRAAGALTIAIIDVDNFADMVKLEGNIAADMTLRSVAGIIDKNLQRGGDTIARFSGDQFVAVMPSTPEAQALGVVERMRTEIESAMILSPTSKYSVLTVSCGLASVESDSDYQKFSVDQIIERASIAMKAAKRAGKNRSRAYSHVLKELEQAADQASLKNSGQAETVAGAELKP